MPGPYAVLNTGDNSDGSTWAKAYQKLATAAGVDAAGDTIYVSNNHTETTAGAVTLPFAGTSANPVRVVCVNDSTAISGPPTTLATTAQVTATGVNNISVTGAGIYCYGIKFSAGDSTNNGRILLSGSSVRKTKYSNCQFLLGGNSASSYVSVGANQTGAIELEDCWFSFANASQYISCSENAHIYGGGILSTSTDVTGGIIKTQYGPVLIENFDFSECGANAIYATGGSYCGRTVIRNCKLAASMTLLTGTLSHGERVEMYNCDSGDTNYILWIEDYFGSIRNDVTVYADSPAGASAGLYDGSTEKSGISWKMVSNGNAKEPISVLNSPEIVAWNSVVGSSQTCTVKINHSGVGAGTGGAFKDDEIWLELRYLGTSGTPLGLLVTDYKSTASGNVLGASADQGSGSAWTAGPATPVPQTLSVSFTARERGYVHARVVLAKASKTVYIDPKLTIA